jgi:hypothetical protein
MTNNKNLKNTGNDLRRHTADFSETAKLAILLRKIDLILMYWLSDLLSGNKYAYLPRNYLFEKNKRNNRALAPALAWCSGHRVRLGNRRPGFGSRHGIRFLMEIIAVLLCMYNWLNMCVFKWDIGHIFLNRPLPPIQSLRRGLPGEDLLQPDDAGPARLADLRRDEGPRQTQVQGWNRGRPPAASDTGAGAKIMKSRHVIFEVRCLHT